MCAGYLCPLNANVYGVEFLKFQIKDYDSDRAVYQVRVGTPPCGHLIRIDGRLRA